MHCIWENVYGNNLMFKCFQKQRNESIKKPGTLIAKFMMKMENQIITKHRNIFFIFILLCISLLRLFDCFHRLLHHKMFVKHYILILVPLLFCLFQKDQIPLAPSANDVVNCVSKGKSQVSFML